MIRMIELFAGIGAQASAMERLGIDHVRVAVAEWDEPTYRVYCAIHGETPNLGDITKVEPSKTRQYQMAGNSIVVDVLEEIFKEIYIQKSFGKCEKRPRIEDFYRED